MGRQLGECDVCGKPRIAKGLCWRHYDQLRAGLALPEPPRPLPCGAELTTEQVRDIRRLKRHGFTLRWIGERYGVSDASVRGVLSGNPYRNVD